MWAIHASPMLFYKSSRNSSYEYANDRQTEILEECFIRRYPYIPPSLTTITNPLTSADLSSRSSRSKTRRDQVIQQDPPALATKYSPTQLV